MFMIGENFRGLVYKYNQVQYTTNKKMQTQLWQLYGYCSSIHKKPRFLPNPSISGTSGPHFGCLKMFKPWLATPQR